MSQNIPSKQEQKRLLDNYHLGKISGIQRIEGGIVNDTFLFHTSRGKFIVQKLRPMFDERVIQDYWHVQTFLEPYEFPISKIITTKDGKICINSKRVWRVLEYIKHDKYVKRNPTNILAAAKVLGRFHTILRNCSYQPKFKIPDFHDTPKIIKKLISTVREKNNARKSHSVKNEFKFISGMIGKHYLPDNLPTTLIHGDPKFNNFLFINNRVVALIDLDTIMVANELIDLGDALRSWCRRGTKFDQKIFDEAMKGYTSENDSIYIAEFAKNAMLMITLELAARFLTDYFEESYFQWDKDNYPNAAAHNLERCQMFISYYKNIIKKSQ
jgi:Ser/Thr protein kinase RdoA (MazF antagonist)